MSANPYQMLLRLQKNPKKLLEDARKGHGQSLIDVANMWDQLAPMLLPMGVLDVFFSHLRVEKVPQNVTEAGKRTTLNDYAYMSLLGLTKAANVLSGGTWEDPGDPVIHDEWGPQLTAAWPGVFAWSKYFFVGRCQAAPSAIVTPDIQKYFLDVIAASWYSMCRSIACRKAIRMTPGAVEMATQMWIIQDKWVVTQQLIDIPTPSAALDAILRNKPDPEEITPEVDNKTPLQRVVAAAGGDPENVARLTLSRLRTALNKPNMEPVAHVAIYLDLMGHFSRGSKDPLRFAFLNANTIGTVTRIAVSAVGLLNQGGDRGLLDVYCACFAYFYNMLETSEGFTWIIQAVNAGMLTAFVDGSPWFPQMIPDDRGIALELINKMIPKYLVYRSVVLAVDAAIQRVSVSPHKERVERSTAAKTWKEFCALAHQRKMLVQEAKIVRQKQTTCDNVHCQKIDEKNTFRKCSGCQSTFYCSKECQTAAWKESHKAMCKLKQTERLEGVSQAVSKLDAQFFHHLFPRDARERVPQLRRIAAEKFPGVPVSELMIQADYTELPQKYDMIKLSDFEKHQPELDTTSKYGMAAMARSEMMVERARQNPGKFALMQSKIVYGEGLHLVTTVVSGTFWSDEKIDPREYVLEAFIEEIE